MSIVIATNPQGNTYSVKSDEGALLGNIIIDTSREYKFYAVSGLDISNSEQRLIDRKLLELNAELFE